MLHSLAETVGTLTSVNKGKCRRRRVARVTSGPARLDALKRWLMLYRYPLPTYGRFSRRGFLSLSAALLVATPRLRAQSAELPAGFVPLFDGTLDNWTIENTQAGNFTVRDRLLRVEGPGGWLRSKAQFADFALHVEVRCLTDDADSGIFLRAAGPVAETFARGWPANAYQVQVRDISSNRTTNPIWIGNLYRHRVAAGETTFDSNAALAAAKPTREWQTIDIDARGDQLTVRLNGSLVTRASNIVNPRGHIGIQGETGVLEYRTIAIRQ